MDPYLAQIILFAGNFAPRGWAFCHGQILPINQNQSLYSLLGTTYGGDGRTSFALPDLRGRVPISQGSGPGLPPYSLGQKTGSHNTFLTTAQLPAHNHGVTLPAKEEANSDVPNNHFVGGAGFDGFGTTSDTTMGALPQNNVGNNQEINNVQPSLGLNYIICLQGLFPSRS